MNNEYYGTVESVKSMARRALNRVRYVDKEYIEAKKQNYRRVYCECGKPVAFPSIVRNRKRVCRECSKIIAPAVGGRTKVHK